jgi:hypothetical protein
MAGGGGGGGGGFGGGGLGRRRGGAGVPGVGVGRSCWRRHCGARSRCARPPAVAAASPAPRRAPRHFVYLCPTRCRPQTLPKPRSTRRQISGKPSRPLGAARRASIAPGGCSSRSGRDPRSPARPGGGRAGPRSARARAAAPRAAPRRRAARRHDRRARGADASWAAAAGARRDRAGTARQGASTAGRGGCGAAGGAPAPPQALPRSARRPTPPPRALARNVFHPIPSQLPCGPQVDLEFESSGQVDGEEAAPRYQVGWAAGLGPRRARARRLASAGAAPQARRALLAVG